MFDHLTRRAAALALGLALAVAGCKGSDGNNGANGATGPTGPTGPSGSSVGSITGTVLDSGGKGFAGAIATTTPLSLASAATDATGAFTIANVPLGTYSLTISGPGIAAVTVPGVTVVANTATSVGNKTVVYSPLVISFATTPVPAGFGKAVPLSATVTGATGALTYTWSVASGPTAGAFDSTTVANPTFTTGTLEAMIAGGKLRNLTSANAPARNGLLAFTAQHVTNSTYSLKLVVSDGTYSQTKNLSLVTAVVSAGQNTGGVVAVPLKIMVLGNTGTVDPAGWTLDVSGASGSTAVLEGASTRNPWFIPDVAGVYVLKNGAAVVSTLHASNWESADANCGVCHPSGSAIANNMAAKFKAWNNSAHGNHFFKYFTYDAAGNLVPKADPTATSVVVPTATPGVNWTLTAPFRPITTYEFGITGGEGGHYSESCMRCHTVGMNKAAGVVNGGIDDVAGYTFPNLGADSDPALPAPDMTKWNALPQAQRDRAGMQCESCHGPVTRHLTAPTATKPKAFYDSGTCGVCHDSGSNHNRFNLWSQSRHANLELAEGEGPNTNCGRCHSAQGFVAWSKMAIPFNPSQSLATAPALADVEPVTCVACHDAHTTGLRVDESKPVTTTSGFTVAGAGVGQLCVICHSSRRGLHNDTIANTSYSLPHAAAQSDLFFGQNVYFFGGLTDGSTVSTHAYVLEGTCGGCHLEPALASEALVGAPTVTNHSFRVSSDLCAKCHEGASVAGLKEQTEGGIALLKTALGDATARSIPTAGFKATLAGVVPAAGLSCNLRATFTAQPRPTTVTIGLPTGHGTGYAFTWAAAVDYTILAAENSTVDCDPATAGTQPITADIAGTIAANTVQGVVLDAKFTALDGTTAIAPANGDLFKAWWNMALIEEERSFGAHNPTFTQNVLAISRSKALAIPAAP